MPWVQTEKCTGCGVCIDECPVDAIALVDDVAVMDYDVCIKCATCFKVCPEEAVRPDGERKPQLVEDNLDWVRRLLEHYETPEAKQGLMGRIAKHFNLQKQVAEATLERLGELDVAN